MIRQAELYLIVLAGIGEGRNRAIYQRAKKLAQNYALTIFTIRGKGVLNEIANISKVIPIPVPALLSKGIFLNLFCSLFILLKLIRKHNITLYTFHRNGFTCAGILKLLKRNQVIWLTDMQHTPYYYWDSATLSHFRIGKRLYYGAIGLFYILAAKVFLPMADQVFAMSFEYGEGFAAIMEKDFNVPRTRLFPIPNGVDISLVEEYIDRKVDLPFALPPGDVRLLYAGNVRIERLALFIEFIEELEKKGITAVFITCGNINPAAKSFLRAQANAKIMHLGFLPHDQLLQLYNLVDACLVLIDGTMRDHLYSHPGKLFEAMGMGKLVLVSDLASIQRVVRDNENGLIVENDCFAEAADKLLHILNSPEKNKRLTRRARKSVKKLDWQTINAQWLAQIRTIAT